MSNDSASNEIVIRDAAELHREDSQLRELEAIDSETEMELAGEEKTHGSVLEGMQMMLSGLAAAAKKASASVSLGALLLGFSFAILSHFGLDMKIQALIGASMFSVGAISGRQIDEWLRTRRILKRIECKSAIIDASNKLIAGQRQRLSLQSNQKKLAKEREKYRMEFEEAIEKSKVENQKTLAVAVAQARHRVLAEAERELESIKQEIERKSNIRDQLINEVVEIKNQNQDLKAIAN